MGVTGLWRLIEPTGKPVPIEALENKVLAVDISIWLHQVVKGYQDAKGAPLPNAHLMGLFQRLCKLLYFRIKPIFVFDGAFPDLKKETIAKRQDHKLKYQSESERLKRELALLLSKQTAISSLLGKQLSPKKAPRVTEQNDDDLFKLPDLPEKVESESESDDEDTSSSSLDLHTVDLEAESFKNMPTKEKYDLLIELKETRKMNSWGRLHELPKKSDTFSDFQMQRLLKRRKLQHCLQETEKEMGSSGMSLNELESLLNEEGIDTKVDILPTRRIASSETSRFILISNVKEAINNAKKREIKVAEAKAGTSTEKTDLDEVEPNNKDSIKTDIIKKNKDELDEDLEKAIKMSLECVDEVPSTSKVNDDSWATIDSDSEMSVSDEDSSEMGSLEMAQAKAYLLQNTDLTEKAIKEIIQPVQKVEKPKSKNDILNEILAELNREKSIIMEKLDSSSDNDFVCSQSNLDADKFLQNIIELDTTSDNEISDSNGLNKSNASSVQMVSNISDDVITIDNSIDVNVSRGKIMEEGKNIDVINKSTPVSLPQSSSSSDDDDDFEEVTECINKKAVVELTLKVGEAPEDDIFADIFTSDSSSIKTESEKPNKIVIEETVNKKVKDTASEIGPQKVVADMLDTNLKNSSNVKIDENITPTSNSVDNIKEVIYEKFESTKSSRPTVKEIPKPIESNKAKIEQNKPNEIPNTFQTKEKPPEQNDVGKSPKIDVEKLSSLAKDLQDEEKDLLQEKSRMDRVGRNITEQMTKEAQELLQIFGIPYIVAPMEAEAQCAFLESAKLTDGTITDDSDIWLFGGRTVYKNFFNQKKHVLQFLSERIEKSFNLSREQLILLAMLVGSDYTTGVPGVGPVTALEILASFPYSKNQTSKLKDEPVQARYTMLVEGLREFKKWVRSGKRTDDSSLKKKLKNVVVNDDFPSVRVVQAYLEPNVEKSEEKFSWGEMDITILRDYTKTKFGWSQHKLDEIIKPVIKRLQDRNTQKTLQNYFKRKIEFQSLEDQMSKRVKAAVQRMDPNAPPEVLNVEEKPKKVTRKRKATSKEVPQASIKTGDDEEIRVVLNLESTDEKAEPSNKSKRKKISDPLPTSVVKVASIESNETKTPINIKVSKTDRYQEIIPQREKDKHSLLQNKLKAIEVFRKTKMDPRIHNKKRKLVIPKEDAGLSESESD